MAKVEMWVLLLFGDDFAEKPAITRTRDVNEWTRHPGSTGSGNTTKVFHKTVIRLDLQFVGVLFAAVYSLVTY